MKNAQILLIMTAILSFAISESARADCPSGQIEDTATGHCLKTGSQCDGKCTWYYDTTTQDLRIEKNANVPDGEDVIIPQKAWSISGASENLNNVTIGEGITGMGVWAFASYGGQAGNANSTLKLPSTYKSSTNNRGDLYDYGVEELWNVSFGTIDASALKDTELMLTSSVTQNIILDPNSNVNVHIKGAYAYGSHPSDVNVVCKGKKSDCESMIKLPYWNAWYGGTSISSEYYKGDDGNGHWEEWSDDGKTVYADSSKTKLLGKYAFDGTQTGSYKYDGAGNLVQAYEDGKLIYAKRIYTPAEAAAATHDGNNNTVSITW